MVSFIRIESAPLGDGVFPDGFALFTVIIPNNDRNENLDVLHGPRTALWRPLPMVRTYLFHNDFLDVEHDARVFSTFRNLDLGFIVHALAAIFRNHGLSLGLS